MAGLLDILFGNGQGQGQGIDPRMIQRQQLQPGQTVPLPQQEQPNAQMPASGLGEMPVGMQQGGDGFMSRVLDPAFAMPMAAALMAPGDIGSNIGRGFAAAAPAIQSRKQSTATAKWLARQGADPQIVEMANSGAGREAMQMWQASKKDPLAQLQYEKTALELDQMRNPRDEYISAGDGNMFNKTKGTFLAGPTGGGDYAKRQAAAAQLGLTPDDPAYKSFILTGKMPREDQSPLTATDKKAILEADEQVSTNTMAIDQLRSVISGPKGQTLNDRAGYGSGASIQSWAARNDPLGIFDDATGEATTELSNVVLGQALGTLKSVFGAAPTEGERKILIELQASTDKTPAERENIIKRGIKLAERRLEFNQQRADQMRGGTFYKPMGGTSGDNGISGASGSSGGLNWSVEQ